MSEMTYIQYGGWCSCSIALEPGCSKFRGEFTRWSRSVKPVGVQPFTTWGAFPFIAQGGAPIYSYLALCLCTVGAQIILVSRRGPLRWSGVGELDPGDLLVQVMILVISLSSVSPWRCPILAQSGRRDHPVGHSGGPLRSCPPEPGSLTWGAILRSSVTRRRAWRGVSYRGLAGGVRSRSLV